MRGLVVEVLMLELGEVERWERTGEKAVFRRRRDPVVERRGVKDWKRLVRLGDSILVSLGLA